MIVINGSSMGKVKIWIQESWLGRGGGVLRMLDSIGGDIMGKGVMKMVMPITMVYICVYRCNQSVLGTDTRTTNNFNLLL